MLLSKQVKYVKEMKEEGSLRGKHADALFEVVEQDLARLNRHKYEVFKENVQRVCTNRLSVIQTKRDSLLARESSLARQPGGVQRTESSARRRGGGAIAEDEDEDEGEDGFSPSDLTREGGHSTKHDSEGRGNSSFSMSKFADDADF